MTEDNIPAILESINTKFKKIYDSYFTIYSFDNPEYIESIIEAFEASGGNSGSAMKEFEERFLNFNDSLWDGWFVSETDELINLINGNRGNPSHFFRHWHNENIDTGKILYCALKTNSLSKHSVDLFFTDAGIMKKAGALSSKNCFVKYQDIGEFEVTGLLGTSLIDKTTGFKFSVTVSPLRMPEFTTLVNDCVKHFSKKIELT